MDATGIWVSIGTVGGTLIVCGIIVWFVIVNTRKQAYSGVVLRKTQDEREGANDGTYYVYTLVVKTDEGQEKRVNVGHKLWETFQVGDKIIKEAGKFSPTKG